MAVQQHARRGLGAVDGAVDAPGRRIGRVRPRHGLLVVGVEQQQLAGLHPREVAPARIHQEAPAVGRAGGAEVVADRLVPAAHAGETEARSHIDESPAFALLTGRPEWYAAVRAPSHLPSDTP